MVTAGLGNGRDAERRVALSYAPAAARAGLSALLELDATFARIVRTTREPMVGQMRLTWWHEALAALDTAPPPAEPVLSAIAEHVVARGVSGVQIAQAVEGWEALLDPLDPATVDRAAGRGAVLFAVMAAVIGNAGGSAIEEAGRGWAYADLSRHLSEPGLAAHAGTCARATLDRALAWRWPAELRALGALALLARDDVAERPSPPAGWRRIARMVRHRLTGR